MRKNGTRVIWILGFRIYYKAIIISKTVWYWHKNRNTGYWNKIEIPEISPFNYGQTMTKEARLHNVAKTVFSTNGPGKTRELHVKENDIRSFFNTIHKNKLK